MLQVNEKLKGDNQLFEQIQAHKLTPNSTHKQTTFRANPGRYSNQTQCTHDCMYIFYTSFLDISHHISFSSVEVARRRHQ